MTDTWQSSRTAIRRLKMTLREADEDTRWHFGFWCIGLGIMAVAIILQFGWLGALFCVGCIIRAAGDNALRS